MRINRNGWRRSLGSATALAMVSAFGVEAAAQQVALEEIVVTSRKRQESLLEIPVSVTAFSQAKLDKLGVNTLEGLSSFAPGFDFNTNTRVTPLIRFRGLEAIVNTAASRTGAVFWEGSYISDGVSILPLMDLERVEIIKGPQTAFFGRNTFSGAVNFISREPDDEWNGKGSVTFSPSNQDSTNVTVAVGGPITDKVGVRVSAMVDRTGADWFFDNGDPNGEINTEAFSSTLVFKPSDNLKIKVNGFYVNSDDTIVQQSQSASTLAGQCNRTYSGSIRNVLTGETVGSFSTDLSASARAFTCDTVPDWDTQPPNMSIAGNFASNPDLFFISVSTDQATTLPVELERHGMLDAPDGLGGQYKLWRLNLSSDYTLSNEATLSTILTRGVANNWYIQDQQFGTPSPVFGDGLWLTGFIRWTRDSYAEVRYASSDDERLRYMIGASYYDQDIEASNLSARKGLSNETGENYGFFGSIDYDITERLTLSLEGRWNEDSQTILFNGPTEILPTETPTVANVEQKFDAFMPRIILSYQPSDNTNLYASFSRSYIQGISTNAENYGAAVPDSGINAATAGFFTPRQSLSAYEIGVKQRPTDWLNYSVAAYYLDWTNQVFADLSPAFVPVNLPGDSRTYGVDLEADILPTDWLQITAGATYNDVKFKNFGAAGSIANNILAPGLIVGGTQIDSRGNSPRWIPEWSGSLSAEVNVGQLIDYEPGAFVRVDSIYSGSFFIDNFEFSKVPGYWKINARAGVNINETFAVEIYGNNLTNDLSWTTGSGSNTSIVGSIDRKDFGSLPRKREVGVKFLASF